MIRFVHIFNYAEGMSANDGEEWYLGKHVPGVRELPGVKKYVSWQASEQHPGSRNPEMFKRYVRRSEVFFETLAEGLKATLGNPDLWTPSTEGEPGFRELECMFLEEEPQYDFLRDVPIQQYKYMGNPLNFSGGEPEWVDDDDFLYWVYFFNYRTDISIADGKEWVVDGEDWYLGQHVREGKIMKQLGKRHYKTWRALRVPSEPVNPLLLGRWYRLTELGVPQGIRYWGNEKAVPDMTAPAEGEMVGEGGYGELRHIIINPELAQDLLE